MHAAPRPDFAPENRSQNAGKVVAVAVFTLLLLGGLATLVVVMTRGSAGIVQPLKGEPGGPPADGASPAVPADAAPRSAETPPIQ